MKLASSFISFAVVSAVVVLLGLADLCTASSLKKPVGLANIENSASDKPPLSSSSTSIPARMLTGSDADVALLESEQCVSVMEVVTDSIEELLDFGDDAIINYMCNVVERSQVTKVIEKTIEDVEDEDEDERRQRRGRNMMEEAEMTEEQAQIHECVMAYERILASHQGEFALVLGSWKDCKEEVDKELIVVKEGRRRHLVECGDHGRCLFPWILVPILVGAIAGGALGVGIYCGSGNC